MINAAVIVAGLVPSSFGACSPYWRCSWPPNLLLPLLFPLLVIGGIGTLIVSGLRKEIFLTRFADFRKPAIAVILCWVFITIVFTGVYVSYGTAYTDFVWLFFSGAAFSAVMTLGIAVCVAAVSLARNRKAMPRRESTHAGQDS
jgi:hypothetical protein